MMDIPERNRNDFRFALSEIKQVTESLVTRVRGTIDKAECSGLLLNIAGLARANDYIKQGLEEPHGRESTDTSRVERASVN